MNISNESLEEIIGHTVDMHSTQGNIIYMKLTPESYVFKEENIHTVLYTYKQWCISKGYVIGPDLDRIAIWSIEFGTVAHYIDCGVDEHFETELKACEWVYTTCKDKIKVKGLANGK